MSAAVKKITPAGDPVQVVQITDTHLKKTPGGKLVGMDTDHSLSHVISLVKAERGPVDLVLGTGDISDHGSEEAYQRAQAFFAELGAPAAWLVGNHDCADTMARVLGNDGALHRAIDSDRWLIVMLNSRIPGEVGGELGTGELDWLEHCLDVAAERGQYVLVCLHHQPVAMGSDWIDQQMVADHDKLFAALAGSGDPDALVQPGRERRRLYRFARSR